MEFLGGWPTAFLAQQVFRHKIRKLNYQIIFWLIVVCHLWLAFDSFLGWRYSRLGYAWLQVLATHEAERPVSEQFAIFQSYCVK